MICPYCQIGYHDRIEEEFRPKTIDENEALGWIIKLRKCPECKKLSLTWEKWGYNLTTAGPVPYFASSILIYPVVRNTLRSKCPPEVPDRFASEYREACDCLDLANSPKASAALSRRCLQSLLREVAKVKHQDLSKEIDEIIKRNELPSDLADLVDAIRGIGNFAAHPIKSEHTNEIIPVEPGEAELSLNILEGLFDFYFVRPASLAKKMAEIDKKLAESGKPPLKKRNKSI